MARTSRWSVGQVFVGAKTEMLERRLLLSGAPVVQVNGQPAVTEGSAYSIQFSATDPGGAAIDSFAVDWGDGAVQSLPASADGASRVFADGPKSRVIRVTATDADGESASRAFLSDPTFAGGGPIFDSNYTPAFMMQPDGKFLTGGRDNGLDSSAFFFRRYNADGSPDATFGSGGLVTIYPFAPGYDAQNNVSALAIAPGGKVVALGTSRYSGTSYLELVRMNPNGSLDPTFNGSGMLRAPDTFASTVAVQSDGAILVGANNAFAFFRYTVDGALDTGFGKNGYVTAFPPSNTFDRGGQVSSIAVQSDGNIIAVGERSLSGSDAVVARVTPTGAFDTTFNGNGQLDISSTIGSFAPERVLVQTDGKLLLGGLNAAGSDSNGLALYDFVLARLNPNGSIDTSFGVNGATRSDFGGDVELINSLAIDAQNRIFAGGSGGTRSDRLGLVARYLPNGTLDTTFHGSGNLTIDLGSTFASIAGIAALPGGWTLAVEDAIPASAIFKFSPGVDVQNVSPTATFTASNPTTSTPARLQFTNSHDPSTTDTAAGFSYSYDFNGDGVFEISGSTFSSATVPASYLVTAGLHTVRRRIQDKDGGHTDYSAQIIVAAPAPATISGLVFNDVNGNPKQDSGEKPLAGRTIYIDKNKNGLLDTGEMKVITSSTGAYRFNNLAAGTYRIRQMQPSGWRATSPSAGYFDVSVSAGQAAGARNFADSQSAVLSGIVFKDTNASGRKDATETGLSGWVLFLDTNNNGKLDAGEKSFITAADGKFTFVVTAGKYNLREVLKTGFRRTAPTSGLYSLTLAAAQIAAGENFGNR